MHITSRFLLASFFVLSFLSSHPCLHAQETHSKALKDFLTSDVIAVAYADISKLDLDSSLELLQTLGLQKTVQYRDTKTALPEIKSQLAELQEAGLSRAYALLRTSDIQDLGTSFIFPVKNGFDLNKAAKTVEATLTTLQVNDLKFGVVNSAVIATKEPMFQSLKDVRPESQVDRSDMWKILGNGTFGFALFGDADSRAVARELMPEIPAPFSELTGDLVADGIKWTGASVDLGSAPSMNFEVEAMNASAAETVDGLLKNVLKIAKFAPPIRQVLPKSEAKLVFNAIAPKRNGNRVTMSAEKLKDELPRLAKIIGPQLQSIRNRARQTQTLNNLRQYALAMLNYEAANGHFPSQAIVDDNGKPLLSWRVAILPFIQQNELYQQFKLDEPWDSAHNIKLVKKMPSIYWNVNSERFETNEEGKTIFQVPSGEGLAFNGENEPQFKDITDGSSNTILIVAMPNQQAVEWTKPEDWQVDLDDHLKPFESAGADTILYSLFDGSVHSSKIEIGKPEIKKLLTPAGGEIPDSSKLAN